jgi:hypothetical protein
MKGQLLDLRRPYADGVALLIFEFGIVIGRAFDGVNSFAEALTKFLASLPNTFRFGVEIRQAHFRALRENGVAHVFNSWTEMPGIDEQMKVGEAFTGNFTAVRALLRPRHRHENSVRMFAPYREGKEPNAEVRALRELLLRAKKRAEPISFL